ncbi:MAG: preprotein translocase subunit YajC [bacterium]
MNELILLAVGQGQQAQPSCVQAALPLLLMFAVVYFLLIRPQQKRQREHQAMLARLKKDDKVVTSGGLVGTVTALTDAEIEIQIADKVRVRVIRAQVQLYQAGQDTAGVPEKKDGK